MIGRVHREKVISWQLLIRTPLGPRYLERPWTSECQPGLRYHVQPIFKIANSTDLDTMVISMPLYESQNMFVQLETPIGSDQAHEKHAQRRHPGAV